MWAMQMPLAASGVRSISLQALKPSDECVAAPPAVVQLSTWDRAAGPHCRSSIREGRVAQLGTCSQLHGMPRAAQCGGRSAAQPPDPLLPQPAAPAALPTQLRAPPQQHQPRGAAGDGGGHGCVWLCCAGGVRGFVRGRHALRARLCTHARHMSNTPCKQTAVCARSMQLRAHALPLPYSAALSRSPALTPSSWLLPAAACCCCCTRRACPARHRLAAAAIAAARLSQHGCADRCNRAKVHPPQRRHGHGRVHRGHDRVRVPRLLQVS